MNTQLTLEDVVRLLSRQEAIWELQETLQDCCADNGDTTTNG